MYKNLNAAALGIPGRINEVIELALTHKFKGMDVEIGPLVQQAEARGVDHATRFIRSAGLKVSGFDWDIDLLADESDFQEQLQRMTALADVATAIAAQTATVTVSRYCDWHPYHAAFQLHCERIAKLADCLSGAPTQIALNFLAPATAKDERGSQFIATPDALVTLIKMIGLERVGLCLDTWQWYVGGGKCEQIESLPGGRVFSVRVADVSPNSDVKTATAQERLLPTENEIVPNVQWLQWLMKHDYAGPITAYAHAAQFTGTPRAQTVTQAAQALDQLLQAATDQDAIVACEA